MQTINFQGRKAGEDSLGTATATESWNLSGGSFDQKKVTLGVDLTSLTLTATDKTIYVLTVVGAGYAITWPANVKWQGAAKQPAASGTTVFLFYYDGTNFLEVKE